MGQHVSIVEKSKDLKLSTTGSVSATWVAQASCPTSCPLLNSGCYAESGQAGFNTRRLNRNEVAEPKSRTELAEIEAQGIRGLSGDRQLRVHVVGDSATPEAARIVGSAMVAHEARKGKTAWTYTHAWKTVKRSDWQGANVLASCHTIAEVKAARKRGYAASVIVGPHPNNKIRMVEGERIVPCPAQFKHNGRRVVTCEHCTLCKRPDWLLAHKLSVGFQADAGTKVIALTAV